MIERQRLHRLLLVEDDERTRSRLARDLASNPRVEVVAEAANRRDGLAALSTLEPDLLVTDLGLPDGSGVDMIRRARATIESCQIMVVTVFGDERNVIAALEAGADSYLRKWSTRPDSNWPSLRGLRPLILAAP